MADTALTMITDALLDLGVLADEEAPTASQAAGALRKLNNMIDSWNIQTLAVYGAVSNVFPLISGKDSYTLGTGGNFNIPRPTEIQSAYLRDVSLPVANRFDYPLYLFNDQEYADVALKGLTGALGQGIYVDGSFPLSNVYIYPVPATAQYSLVLWTSGLINNFTLNQAVILAPGYKRALTSNLALELAPSYGVEPSQSLVKIAQDSLMNIKTQNFQLNELQIDERLTGVPWNYITGGY